MNSGYYYFLQTPEFKSLAPKTIFLPFFGFIFYLTEIYVYARVENIQLAMTYSDSIFLVATCLEVGFLILLMEKKYPSLAIPALLGIAYYAFVCYFEFRLAVFASALAILISFFATYVAIMMSHYCQFLAKKRRVAP